MHPYLHTLSCHCPLDEPMGCKEKRKMDALMQMFLRLLSES